MIVHFFRSASKNRFPIIMGDKDELVQRAKLAEQVNPAGTNPTFLVNVVHFVS
jgi:hypothetical protein